MARIPRVCVGIDYHEAFCTVCVMQESGKVVGVMNVSSDAGVIFEYVPWICRRAVEVVAAIEVCGGAAQMADKLRQLGWQVDLAHSGYVSQMKQRQDKTDTQDAELLADLVRVGYVPRVWLPPERLRQLRSLVHYRQQLCQARRQTKLRVRALMREAGLRLSGRAWTVDWLHHLQQHLEDLGELRAWICCQHLAELDRLVLQVQEVEKQLKQQLAGDPQVEKLLAQKSVGLVTAATLIAEIGDFRRFAKGKQLARFCGTAPVNFSTGGKTRERGLGRQCNRELRRVIIETAHRLGRCVPRWQTMKQNLRSNGKSGAETAVAIANRWIRWLHYEMTRSIQEKTQAAQPA